MLMTFSKSLERNLSVIRKSLPSDDVCFSRFNENGKSFAVVFLSSLADKTALGELIIKPMISFAAEKPKKQRDGNFTDLFSPEKKEVSSVSDALKGLLGGETLLFVDGTAKVFCFSLKKSEKRAVTEPPTSTVVKGPREGFVESVEVNISLIRRRIKTPDLIFSKLSVGERTKTEVFICYLKGVVRPSLVRKVIGKIKMAKIDHLLDSSYLSKILSERKTSLFKQFGNTEKPDVLSAKLLEGRIGILVDGSPIAITLPYLIAEDFQGPGDYYASPYHASMSRIIRLFSVLVAIYLPSIFVSAELFHLQIIPLQFLLTIVNSIKGIPLSPSFEMFFTLLIFEILNEASVRMPRYVGMVVSIVGGLVLGETAVTAGIISAPTLMIVALSGICLFTVPELEQTFSVIRIVFLAVAGSFGAYGLLLISAAFLIYMTSFESFRVPVMAPFAPLIKADLKDSVLRGFMTERQIVPMALRNTVTATENRVKNKENRVLRTDCGSAAQGGGEAQYGSAAQGDVGKIKRRK